MNLASAAILLGLIAVFGLALWGLVARQRSVLLGVVASGVALLAALGAWYAWAESGSTAWTVGYGLVALLGLLSAIRQFVGGASSRR